MPHRDVAPVDIVYLSADESVLEVIETVQESVARRRKRIERFGNHYTLVRFEPATEGSRARLFYRDEAV